MSTERGFLDAIRAHPDDPAVKLIYADWLEEAGDPRGPFLRLSLALAAMSHEDEHYADLYASWRKMRPSINAEWLAQVDRANAADDVREAVFRHQLRDGPDRGLYFLQVEKNDDPSPYLLARVCALGGRIKPLSDSKLGDGDGVVDRESEEWGIILRVGKLRWLTSKKCEAEGGYWAGGLAADGNLYRIELKNGVWVVTQTEFLWIS